MNCFPYIPTYNNNSNETIKITLSATATLKERS